MAGEKHIDLSRAYQRATREGRPGYSTAIRAVAERSRLAKETVHQIARNKGDPKLSTLIAIAGAFGLTVVEFLKLGIVEREAER